MFLSDGIVPFAGNSLPVARLADERRVEEDLAGSA